MRVKLLILLMLLSVTNSTHAEVRTPSVTLAEGGITTNLSAQQVLELIYLANIRPYAVIVQTKSNEGQILNYGHRLGDGYEMEFTDSEVFLGDAEESLNSMEELITPKGFSINHYSDLTDVPLLGLANELKISSIETGYLYSEQRVTNIITQAEDLTNINPLSKFNSVEIIGSSGELLGYYIEESGLTTDKAVLAYLIKERGMRDNDIWIDDNLFCNFGFNRANSRHCFLFHIGSTANP